MTVDQLPPALAADGTAAPRPRRDLIAFLSFAVVVLVLPFGMVVTLLQGLDRLPVLGWAGTFASCLVGAVLAVVGLRRTRRLGRPGRSLAVAALALSASVGVLVLASAATSLHASRSAFLTQQEEIAVWDAEGRAFVPVLEQEHAASDRQLAVTLTGETTVDGYPVGRPRGYVGAPVTAPESASERAEQPRTTAVVLVDVTNTGTAAAPLLLTGTYVDAEGAEFILYGELDYFLEPGERGVAALTAYPVGPGTDPTVSSGGRLTIDSVEVFYERVTEWRPFDTP